MTDDEYDELLREIVAGELEMHDRAVAGVADELDELLDVDVQ